MKKIYKYVLIDILRNTIMIFYTLLLLVASLSIFSLEDTSSKGLLSMLNIILMIVPLISIVFSTIYMYNSGEFLELLLSQPLRRSTIWSGLFGGLITSLGLSFLIGAGLVILIFAPNLTGLLLTISGILLSIAFSAFAMVASVFTRDKAKGIGIAILLWLFYSVLFDGIVMFLMFQLSDYPIEKYMIAVSMLNPIDLTRILVLMQMDVSALMGYTGAIFENFFGTTPGIIISFIMLVSWGILPLIISLIKFKKKDI